MLDQHGAVFGSPERIEFGCRVETAGELVSQSKAGAAAPDEGRERFAARNFFGSGQFTDNIAEVSNTQKFLFRQGREILQCTMGQ